MRVWRMRTGISITLKLADRGRLKVLAWDRNTPHKHVWRAEIVLLSADRVGTNEIMRRTGKSKTCVWRWQERFMQEGYDGLLRDKTRPSRIQPLGSTIAERGIDLLEDRAGGGIGLRQRLAHADRLAALPRKNESGQHSADLS